MSLDTESQNIEIQVKQSLVMTDLPETEQELLEELKKLTRRQYERQFGFDRHYAQQVYAFARNHPKFLVDTLLELTDANYSSEKEKISAFYDALELLVEDEELRIKLQHSSLDKTL